MYLDTGLVTPELGRGQMQGEEVVQIREDLQS